MSDLPYTIDVLRLAAEASGAGRLAPPCVSHSEFNPACGDRCTVDLRVDDRRIQAIAHETKACVLTQASASLLGRALPGHDLVDVMKLRVAVAAMLNGAGPPVRPFAGYAHLADVARLPGRHRCVLLPIDAVLKALEKSETGKPGG